NSTLAAGVYESPPSIYSAIHSLEHGAVVIWYAPSASDAELSRIKDFFSDPAHNDHVIVAPYSYPDQGAAGGLPSGTDMVLVAGLLAFGLTRDPGVVGSPLIGRPAPEFVLRTLDGSRIIALSDLRGQVVVVNFWASWCAACREEHPNLLAAWNRYRDHGVV